jgi:hypothetical protein
LEEPSMRTAAPLATTPRAVRRNAAASAAFVACAAFCSTSGAIGSEMVQLDPFAQATDGYPGCAATPPPLLTLEQSRVVAHERAERGTRCAMEGTCEPGGAYRRDGEVNEKVRAALAANRAFADTSLWLTTTRKWVTLSGCVHTQSERRSVVKFVQAQPMVERVFDEVRIGTMAAAPK